MATLNKPDIIQRMAEKNGLTYAFNEAAMNSLVDVLRDAMVLCETVYLHGLGTFKAKERKAWKCRDPKSGRVVEVAARLRATFRPTKDLQDI